MAAVTLDQQHQRIMDFAAATCRGPAEWQNRKRIEAHSVLALDQISHRFHVEWIDLFDAMRVSLLMKVPVPCLPNPTQPVQIQSQARLALTYRRESIFIPQPGYSAINILWPPFVFHSNVAFDPRQPLCLGARLSANLPATELLVQSYLAISLQTVSLDILDSAGLLNPAAADYWGRNLDRIPLSREPFVRLTEELK
jgi:hypothetical protein